MIPFSIRSSKKAMSSGRRESRSSKSTLSISSAREALPARSQKAISGSIIQNSERWRLVFEFSARNVGPKVYTRESAQQYVSTLSWPDTVRCASLPKKSPEWSTCPYDQGGIPGFSLPHFSRRDRLSADSPSPVSRGRGRIRSSVLTRNICPAPSQSLAVMIGVWT